MKGLAPHTARIFDAITRLQCIKPYTLVGGTALALQLGTRKSEDLDFMTWRTSKNETREVDWPAIQKELETIGTIENREILDLDHVTFIVEGVKTSFYASPNHTPVQNRISFQNNLCIADLTSIGAMKMEVMLRRSKFRDYYDIYSLLEAGISFTEMMRIALKYSGHRLKSKNLIALLTNSDRFVPDAEFPALEPVYDISPKEIEQRVMSAVKAEM